MQRSGVHHNSSSHHPSYQNISSQRKINKSIINFQRSTRVGLVAICISSFISIIIIYIYLQKDNSSATNIKLARRKNMDVLDSILPQTNDINKREPMINGGGGRSPEKSIWSRSTNHHPLNGIMTNQHGVLHTNSHINSNNNNYRNQYNNNPTSTNYYIQDDQNNVYKTANLFAVSVPENTLKFKSSIKIEEKRVQALDLTIFYREAQPPKGHFTKGEIFLLHGQAFTSANWLEKETIQTFASAGYRVVAVDLPGYGQTSGRTLKEKEKPNLIEALVNNLKLNKPVLVSPSMSGSYSIPFVVNHSDELSAFIPVAPVGAGDVKPAKYRKIKLPTLIVYGERDTSLGILSASKLKVLPNSRVIKIASAGHACYLNNPEAFHTVVLNFLDLVRENEGDD